MTRYWSSARWGGFAALALVTWTLGGGACASVPDEEPSDAPEVSGDAAEDAGTGVPNDAGPSTGTEGWTLVEFPRTSETLSGVWGSGPSDVWAVGSRGTILHWDGSRWDTSESGSRVALRAVWGSGPHDVWAVGTMKDVLHSSGWQDGGSRWVEATGVDGGLREVSYAATGAKVIAPSIWGSSATDVWLTSLSRQKNGWHSDGWAEGNVSWRNVLVYPDYGSAIWGSDSENVWVVGQNGTIARSAGYKAGLADWVPVNSGTRANLNAIWGTDTDDVWVVGDNGVIRHWTYDDADVLRWNPSSSGTERALFAVWGSSATDVWVAGEDTILHWNGSSWSPSAIPSLPPNTRFFGIWGSGPDDVWIVGDSVILHRSGSAKGVE